MGKKGFVIYHDVPINSSIEKVFNAISEPKELIKWWPLKCSGERRIGGEYNFYFDEPYDWFGKVSTYIINESFHIKMTKSDKDWNPTSFGFDLVEKEGITWVKFFHKDWPYLNDEFKNSSYCWAMLLNGLKNYVEKGAVISFEKRN